MVLIGLAQDCHGLAYRTLVFVFYFLLFLVFVFFCFLFLFFRSDQSGDKRGAHIQRFDARKNSNSGGDLRTSDWQTFQRTWSAAGVRPHRPLEIERQGEACLPSALTCNCCQRTRRLFYNCCRWTLRNLGADGTGYALALFVQRQHGWVGVGEPIPR